MNHNFQISSMITKPAQTQLSTVQVAEANVVNLICCVFSFLLASEFQHPL